MAGNSAADRIAVAAIDAYTETDVDCISEQYVEWQMAKENFEVEHGPNHTWQARIQRPATQTFQSNSTFNYAGANYHTRATLANKGYACTGLISKVDLAECSGKQRLIELVKSEVTAHNESLARSFGLDFFLDGLTLTNSSAPIIGLAGAVKSSGTYAGVSYTDNPAFFGSGENVLSGGVHATFSASPAASLNAAITAVCRGDSLNDGPENLVVLMHPTDWLTVANNIQDQERQNTPGSETKRFGANKLIFRGVPIVMTRQIASSGTYWVVNKKDMKWLSPFNSALVKDNDKVMSPLGIIYFSGIYGALAFRTPRLFAKVTVS